MKENIPWEKEPSQIKTLFNNDKKKQKINLTQITDDIWHFDKASQQCFFFNALTGLITLTVWFVAYSTNSFDSSTR